MRLFTIVLLGVVSGCALTTEHINLAYQPQSAVETVRGAAATTVLVTVKDERSSPDVAHKVNGFNVEMAPIVADNDVPELIRNSIDLELRDRGFNAGGGGVTVLVALQTFRNYFQVGLVSGTATADLTMNVKVAGLDRRVLYDQLIVAQGVNSGIQMASGNNAKIALDAALQDAMAKLFNDPKFIDSLQHANQVV